MSTEIIQPISVIVSIGILINAMCILRNAQRQTKGSTLLGCLQQYVVIRRIRRDAVANKDAELAEQYYRELVDLCWTEFRLWQAGLLDYNVFFAWMDSRCRSFSGDGGIPTEIDGATVTISQKAVWQKLVDGGYFGAEDDFLSFMTLVHDSKVETALADYRRSKRRSK